MGWIVQRKLGISVVAGCLNALGEGAGTAKVVWVGGDEYLIIHEVA